MFKMGCSMAKKILASSSSGQQQAHSSGAHLDDQNAHHDRPHRPTKPEEINDFSKLEQDPRIPLNVRQIFKITKSWKAIARTMSKTGTAMFLNLFEQNQDLFYLFDRFQHLKGRELHESMELREHAATVMSTLDQSINSLSDYDNFVTYLHSIGELHRKVPGFKREHFWKIEQPFMRAIKQTLDERCNETIEEIYKIAIKLIIETIADGYGQDDPTRQPSSNPPPKGGGGAGGAGSNGQSEAGGSQRPGVKPGGGADDSENGAQSGPTLVKKAGHGSSGASGKRAASSTSARQLELVLVRLKKQLADDATADPIDDPTERPTDSSSPPAKCASSVTSSSIGRLELDGQPPRPSSNRQQPTSVEVAEVATTRVQVDDPSQPDCGPFTSKSSRLPAAVWAQMDQADTQAGASPIVKQPSQAFSADLNSKRPAEQQNDREQLLDFSYTNRVYLPLKHSSKARTVYLQVDGCHPNRNQHNEGQRSSDYKDKTTGLSVTGIGGCDRRRVVGAGAARREPSAYQTATRDELSIPAAGDRSAWTNSCPFIGTDLANDSARNDKKWLDEPASECRRHHAGPTVRRSRSESEASIELANASLTIHQPGSGSAEIVCWLTELSEAHGRQVCRLSHQHDRHTSTGPCLVIGSQPQVSPLGSAFISGVYSTPAARLHRSVSVSPCGRRKITSSSALSSTTLESNVPKRDLRHELAAGLITTNVELQSEANQMMTAHAGSRCADIADPTPRKTSHMPPRVSLIANGSRPAAAGESRTPISCRRAHDYDQTERLVGERQLIKMAANPKAVCPLGLYSSESNADHHDHNKPQSKVDLPGNNTNSEAYHDSDPDNSELAQVIRTLMFAFAAIRWDTPLVDTRAA